MLRKYVNHGTNICPNRFQFMTYYKKHPELKELLKNNWTKVGSYYYKFSEGIENNISVLIKLDSHVGDQHSVLFCGDRAEFY